MRFRDKAIAGLVALALPLALAAAPALAAGTGPAVLYKVEFSGTGTEHVADSEGESSLDQNATWRLQPQSAEIWLPKVSAPPGPGNEIKTEAIAPEQVNPSGEVKETGTYPESGGPASYSCSGPTNNNTSMIDTAEVGPYTTSVTLTGDFFGSFLTGFTGSFGNQEGVGSCDTDPEKGYEPQYGNFFYFWDPEEPESEDNTRMEVGATIPPQDVGQQAFGLVAEDFSSVHNSLGCEWNDPTSGCTLEFHLEGSWDLTKLCEGTAASGGGEGSQGGAAGNCTPPNGKEEKKKDGKEKGKGKGGKSGGKANSPKLGLVSAAAKGAGAKAELKCAGPKKTVCAGSLSLVFENKPIGSKSASLAAGKSKSVTVKLDRKGKKLLAASHGLKLKLEVKQKLGGKSKSVATKRLTLKG